MLSSFILIKIIISNKKIILYHNDDVKKYGFKKVYVTTEERIYQQLVKGSHFSYMYYFIDT